MTKSLIIIRHGNTFLPEQTPTRVGCHTDLALVEETRSRAVGKYLKNRNIVPDRIFAAPLKRTTQTAKLIIDELGLKSAVIPEKDFIEIDYGPDENKTEDQVKLRIGRDYMIRNQLPPDTPVEKLMEVGESVIELWNTKAIVPQGWKVNVNSIIESWKEFADNISDGEIVLICTSNGIIRFAPHILTEGYEKFCSENDIKVTTGSVSIFEHKDGEWKCKEWNSKPYKLF